MAYCHQSQKHVKSDRKTPAVNAGKKQSGFSGLNPSTMGLDLPDWLSEPAATSSPPKPQQLDNPPAPGMVPRSRTLIEGLKVVCICKGIKRRVFWQALDEGACTKEEINRLTGSGSGGCQGRRCGPRILEMLRKHSR
ncbi:hypothetical protein NKDENANG_03868 [Candidatus Entotheonellaceae bacterium PAL068K]